MEPVNAERDTNYTRLKASFQVAKERATRYLEKKLSFAVWPEQEPEARSAMFEAVHRKCTAAWDSDFALITRSDPAYKAAKGVFWGHVKVPVIYPTIAFLVVGLTLARRPGRRMLVKGFGFGLGVLLMWLEFGDNEVDLDLERTFAILRTADSPFSRECRALLRSAEPNHWVLKEFDEEYGSSYDAKLGEELVQTSFPMEFPIPEKPAPSMWENPSYEDPEVRKADEELLKSTGLNPQQTDYLLTEPRYERCWPLEEEYQKCMDSSSWKDPALCKTLEHNLTRCYYQQHIQIYRGGG